MQRSDLSVGDKVIFGSRRGEETLGEIVKLNPRRAKVRTLEDRGRVRHSTTGAVWTVPYSLISKAPEGAKPQEKAAPEERGVRDFGRQAADFKKGDRVKFEDRVGKIITGTVIRVNQRSVSVEPDDGRSRYWRVAPSMLRREGETVPVRPVTKRTEEEILRDLSTVECNLSPENLTCDGELPRYQVQRRYSKLMAEKRALIRELGREPTDQEIWGVSFAV
jgi:hypothetical protein